MAGGKNAGTAGIRAGMIRAKTLAVLLGAVMVLIPVAARAGVEQDIAECLRAKLDVAQTIAVCSRALTSRHLAGDRLIKVYALRGDAYYRDRQYFRAINDFDAAIRLRNDDPDFYFSRARALARAGSFDHAIADFSAALRHRPGFALAYYGRGLAHAWRREYRASVNDHTEAIRLKPDFGPAFGGRGWAHYYLGNFEAAATDFAREVELKGPPYAALWLYLALRRAGKNADARLAAVARAFEPGQWPQPLVRFYLGEIDAAGVLAGARDANAETANVNVCEAHFYIGEHRLLQGKTQEAHDDFREASIVCPRDVVEFIGAWVEIDRLAEQPKPKGS
jgi:lipoprotein NlpI